MIEVFTITLVYLLFAARRSFAEEGLDTYYDLSEGNRNAHKWGFDDTRFEFDGPQTVKVTGNRYPLAGYRMPYFIPFVEEVLGIPIRPEDMGEEQVNYELPDSVSNPGFLSVMGDRFRSDQIAEDSKVRLVHSHGQLSVDEIYRVLNGGSLDRVVDLVFYPENEDDVKDVVGLALTHNVCLVPYGGGTNVSGALACPTEEGRMIVSVDMGRMNRILWLDEENFQASVEAGIFGKELERILGERGYTSGHDPDSVELSTLGGWIATNASGMKKNKYGNIEDIVLEASLVTPTGEIETTSVTPRNSTGTQPRAFLFGSEGNFGIITRAVIKIHPLPEVRQYGMFIFHSFERGVDFLKALRQSGTLPASIRLVNNNEFRFGRALKPEPTFPKKIKEKFQEFMLGRILKFQKDQMVACTIVMEGTREEVKQQEKAIFRLGKKHNGVSAGASNGKRGYTLTFGIAYIRDFFNQFQILGETFETSVPWSNIHHVCGAVKTAMSEQAEKYQLPGKPYLAYRVTQTYHTGVCIYFTMGFSGKGIENPESVFHKIEHHLRQVILNNGGSLSHHHGVGKIRQGFLNQIQTENSIRVLRHSKKAMDPENIFGIRNGVFNDLPD